MHNREGKDTRENGKQLTSDLRAFCTAEHSRGGLLCHFLCSFACLKRCVITKEKEQITGKKPFFVGKGLEVEGRRLGGDV